jgi:(p)ppGpp synthase/HD superfamily hydrolase
MSKLDTAIELANYYHKDQKYAEEPYINHLNRVCQNVKDCYYGEDYQVVAMLHDVVEDTDCDFKVIYDLFGGEITDAVRDMTHPKNMEYIKYLDMVLTNPISKVVKFADIMDNMKNSYINEGYERLQIKYEKAMKYMIANWNKYN